MKFRKFKVGDRIHVYGLLVEKTDSPDGSHYYAGITPTTCKVTNASFEGEISVKILDSIAIKSGIRKDLKGFETSVHPIQCVPVKKKKK